MDDLSALSCDESKRERERERLSVPRETPRNLTGVIENDWSIERTFLFSSNENTEALGLFNYIVQSSIDTTNLRWINLFAS